MISFSYSTMTSSSLGKFILIICATAFFTVIIYVYQTNMARSSPDVQLPPPSSNRIYNLKGRSQQPSQCSCLEGAQKLRDYVNKDKFGEITRRRAEEYKKYQMRKTSKLNQLLFAPPNSPLQYPIQGFIVTPLHTSLIPGLSVHAAQKQHFQVTLSVTSGVLAVQDLQDMDKVKGQGEKVLSISTSSLQSLNDLLERVSYTSTVYSIKSGDLVHFTFGQHKAIFPIVIKQPTVPVLYDQGDDINSQVTITTKTFLRYPELNHLIRTIRRFYKDIKIIIADDSFDQQKVNSTNTEQYFLPPSQGWFAGRNLAVSQVTTKYFLWVDDDFEFTNNTKIEKFVEIMEAIPELDVVGGSVGSNTFSFKLIFEDGDEEGGCLRRVTGSYQPIPGFPNCVFTSGVVNFFMGRTDAVRKVGFDPLLKRVAHSEFFMDGLGELLVGSCPKISISHQPKKSTHGEYDKYRHPPSSDTNSKLALHFFKNHLKCVNY
ncbi:hypothetical protein AAFF_G00046120 [Aldrovandia affinis]|uniref:Glycosyltransferase 2-like domain-containing protein n=1 Tax=Aldrovandia affinis TaxID=143900 RepID=A0AAD7S418_9TELE|nr:hypothetical protein AAFF_G00046120 [Aldrovandia affinis]